MFKTKNRTKLIVIAVIVLIALASLQILSMADGAEPGSEADPIVTLSFVDKKIEQIKYYIDSSLKISRQDIDDFAAKLEEMDALVKELEKKVENSLTFEVIEMKKGQSLIADEGAEIIVRSGKSTAIYGQKGGLSDITSAKDLQRGEAIELNHMLIASRGDGRGVKADSTVFLIIKGGYILK